MKNNVTLLEKFGLTTAGLNYSKSANAIVTKGYTSKAGNVYFNSLRLAEGIIIKEDIGKGHTHSFLNGIKIFELKNKTLIAEESFHCEFYSKITFKKHLKKMLLDTLKKEANAEGYDLDIKQTHAIIDQVIKTALNENQSILFTKQLKGN